MYRNCPEHSDITHILLTGYPPQQTYPERDDVELVEIGEGEYTKIVQQRNAEKGKYIC